MIKPKLSFVPAKNRPNFGARPHKIANCEKSTPFKYLKTFLLIFAALLPRCIKLQRRKCKQSTFYLLLQADYNQSKLAFSQQKGGEKE